MRKFSFLIVLALLLYASSAFSSLSPDAYKFSTLLSRTDCVIAGKVIAVEKSMSPYTLQIENVLYGTCPSIISAANEAGIPDRVFMGIGDEKILFLKREGENYIILNGIAGSAKINTQSDFQNVLDAFSSDAKLFSSENITILKDLFYVCKNKSVKRRLLLDMDEILSASDEPFIKTLLESDDTDYQKFAALEAGQLKLHSLNSRLVSICNASNKTSVKIHCIIALGHIAEKKTVPIITTHLTDANTSIKRAAAFSAGLSGYSEMAEPLLMAYNSSDDSLMKQTVIIALSQVDDSSVSLATLEALNNNETNNMLIAEISKNIKIVREKNKGE